MTTLQRTTLDCPLCGGPFESHLVTNTNAFGGKRTDFHERAAGAQPHPHLMHTCPTCLFTGYLSKFKEPELFEDQFLRSTLKDKLQSVREGDVGTSGSLTGSLKYLLAATIEQYELSNPRVIGDHLLRAAWCAFDEQDVEGERYYRIESAKWFTLALGIREEAVMLPHERALYYYLVGELYRRAGDVKKATWWFDNVESQLVEPKTQAWLIAAARQQRDSPREWFG